MKRILNINLITVTGDSKIEILEVFPDIENKFRLRNEFDEYYFDEVLVELSIEIIDSLNKLGFDVKINWERVTLS